METRTWQYRFDVGPLNEEQIREAIKNGISSRKDNYPIAFWGFVNETKTKNGEGTPHVHLVVEYQEPHNKNINNGIRDRIASALGLQKANSAKYSSGVWKDHTRFIGYLCKENMLSVHGEPKSFVMKPLEECIVEYKEFKGSLQNVFKIKSKELIDAVVYNVRNNSGYGDVKKIDKYRELIIDEYLLEAKKRKHAANFHQIKSDVQKIILILSYENTNIQNYLRKILYDSI